MAELRKALPDFVQSVEIAGHGFINFKIKDRVFAEDVVRVATQDLSLDRPKVALSGGPTSSIAFHTEGDVSARCDLAENKDIMVFIGPEGGWSEKELEVFHTHSIPVKCLGTQVLRAETAVVAALSVVMLGK